MVASPSPLPVFNSMLFTCAKKQSGSNKHIGTCWLHSFLLQHTSLKSVGQIMPPLIINSSKSHTFGEPKCMETIGSKWQFAQTANEWTSNQLAVMWLEHIFGLHSKSDPTR